MNTSSTRLGLLAGLVALGSMAFILPLSTAGAAGSPSVVATETPTAGPTPRPTETPTQTITATITLSSEPDEAKVKSSVLLSGTVASGDPACVDGLRVDISRTTLGTTDSNNAARLVIDATGAFEATVMIQASAEYVATSRANRDTPQCAVSSSEPVTVLAHALLEIAARPTKPERGTKFVVSGRLNPAHPGSRVVLQKKTDGGWSNAGRATVEDGGRFSFEKKAGWKGRRVFRAVWPQGDADHEPGKSNRIKIKTTKPRDRGGDSGGRGGGRER